MKILDEAMLLEFRCKPMCEHCGRRTQTGLDPHHIIAKGMGGANRMDVLLNLVALCRQCHMQVHDGHISRTTLLGIVARREDMSATEVFDTLRRKEREASRHYREADQRADGRQPDHQGPGVADPIST